MLAKCKGLFQSHWDGHILIARLSDSAAAATAGKTYHLSGLPYVVHHHSDSPLRHPGTVALPVHAPGLTAHATLIASQQACTSDLVAP